VGKQDRQGRQACLGGKDRGGRGQETVRNPALDLSPVNLHLGEEVFGGNEKVRTIGEDQKEEGESEAVTEVGGDPQSIGGEAPNRSEGCLGKGESAGKVGGRGEVGDKPVTEPSELRGGVEELAIKGYRRRPAGGWRVPLPGGSPVYELRFGNREVNMPCVGNCP